MASPPKRTQTRTIDKKPAFLAAFAACASITEAAAAVEMDRGQHYDWLKDDPAYATAFAEAKQQAGDTLRDDAVQWARIGIFEPLVYQGEFCYAKRSRVRCLLETGVIKWDDELVPTDVVVERKEVEESYGPPLGIYRRSEGLHARLLKAFKPDEFGDKAALELSGPGGGPMEIVARLNAARARVKPKPKE